MTEKKDSEKEKKEPDYSRKVIKREEFSYNKNSQDKKKPEK